MKVGLFGKDAQNGGLLWHVPRYELSFLVLTCTDDSVILNIKSFNRFWDSQNFILRCFSQVQL